MRPTGAILSTAIVVLALGQLSSISARGTKERSAGEGLIALYASHPREAGVYVVDLGSPGKRPERLILDAREPVWSPDGKRLAFSRDDPDPEIFVFELATRRITQITDNAVADVDPSWSPDGTKLAFGSTRGITSGDDAFKVIVHDIPTGSEHVVPLVSFSGTGVSWAPDGTRFAYSCQPRRLGICVSGVDGSDQRLVVDDADLPAWSPDGTKIAFMRGYWVVWTISPDGTGAERVFGVPARLFPAFDPFAWSPDGSTVAIVTVPLTDPSSRILMVELASGKTTRVKLPGHLDFEAAHPSWLPSTTGMGHAVQ